MQNTYGMHALGCPGESSAASARAGHGQVGLELNGTTYNASIVPWCDVFLDPHPDISGTVAEDTTSCTSWIHSINLP